MVNHAARRQAAEEPGGSVPLSHPTGGTTTMAHDRPTTPYELIPQLGRLRDQVLFGDVWEQPELSKRDRSLITVAVLTALYRTEELRGHMKRALDNGVTEDEIKGLITHLAFYAGWPTAVNAGRVALEVLKDS
jgi:4-carboxymuconolactone decarboxylase